MDSIEIRDFAPFVPDGDGEQGALAWRIRPYRLLDGTQGNMLYCNGRVQKIAFDGSGLPAQVSIPMPGEGNYAIYLGIPALFDKPIVGGFSAGYGVDAAVDGDPFVPVALDVGVRCGRILKEGGREYFCFFRNVACKGGSLHIRVPYGAMRSLPLGHVRAMLSCVRFVRLPDGELPRKLPGIDEDFEQKPLIVVSDGFSHYFDVANTGECADVRLVESCRMGDVRIIMSQMQGATTWKSGVTSYYGEGLGADAWEKMRSGDRRIHGYLHWALHNQAGPMEIQAQLCHRYGMEFHFSLRANLFFPFPDDPNARRFFNGDWWMDHPDARLAGSHKLDYGNPKTQDYILSLFGEVMENFDVDGINLDCTRWAPILDNHLHTSDVMPGFIARLRRLADAIGRKKGRHLALSMFFVEGYHINQTLQEQLYDFERLMEEGNLDFVGVEAADIGPYCQLAHQHGRICYGVQDGESPHHPGGWRSDPLWVLPDGSKQDDPAAGEEYLDQPDIRSCLSSQEYSLCIDRMYREGADGICYFNNFMGSRELLDNGSPSRVRERVASGTVYGEEIGQYLFIEEGE